jgi:hypothetical protein
MLFAMSKRASVLSANALALAGIVGLACASSTGCSELRIAEPTEGGAATTTDASDPGVEPGSDAAQPGADAGTDAPKGPLLYDEVQAKLEAKRAPGPTTSQGSKGYCTSKYFVWKDSDGTLHSWAGKTQARIDYGFKAPGTRPYFVPADTYIAVDIPSYAQQDVYRTDTTNSLVGSIPYSFNFVSANDGVILLDQKIGNGPPLNGTKVRRWKPTGPIEDITATVLPTTEPPSSFVNDVVVIPGSVTIPYPLYLVDVVKKTTGSVTFDGGIALQQTEQFAGGLAVAYVRNGSAGSALRIYKGDKDDAASRFELGDEVANRAAYFSDSPGPLEHKFLTRVTTWGQTILYASAYGIWSYHLATGAMVPVQLAANKKTAVPDVMCVLADAGLLVYRMSGDTVGQIWAVPLTSVLQ